MIYPAFQIDERIQRAARHAMEEIAPVLKHIDEITDYNQQKMLAAFIDSGVSESHFAASTGYGYGQLCEWYPRAYCRAFWRFAPGRYHAQCYRFAL